MYTIKIPGQGFGACGRGRISVLILRNGNYNKSSAKNVNELNPLLNKNNIRVLIIFHNLFLSFNSRVTKIIVIQYTKFYSIYIIDPIHSTKFFFCSFTKFNLDLGEI